MPVRQLKEMRRCYGFEEVAIVPGDVTVNPEQTNIDLKLGNLTFPVPILAAAMDAVVDPKFAVAFSKLGGLAVLNLEGVQARYEKPERGAGRDRPGPHEPGYPPASEGLLPAHTGEAGWRPDPGDKEQWWRLRRLRDAGQHQEAGLYHRRGGRGRPGGGVHRDHCPAHVQEPEGACLLRTLQVHSPSRWWSGMPSATAPLWN